MSNVNSLFQDEQEEAFNEALAHEKMAIQSNAISLARTTNQTVGVRNDFYITLAQLEQILMKEC